MSMFSWFSKSNPSDADVATQGAGLRPVGGPASVGMPQAKGSALPQDPSASRKTERIERREQLYGVVRDAMTRAGILSSGYKFKVLSLDPRGRQYLIMMDLTDQSAGDADRLAEIEALIAQFAKTRFEILVTAVYWRVNASVTAGLSSAKPGLGAPVSRPAPLSSSSGLTSGSAPSATPGFTPSSSVGATPPRPAGAMPATAAAGVAVAAVGVAGHSSRYEPIQDDEVLAFKNALASAAPGVGLVASGEIVKSGRRNPAQPQEFENTELLDHDDRASPLSTTQYGDLN